VLTGRGGKLNTRWQVHFITFGIDHCGRSRGQNRQDWSQALQAAVREGQAGQEEQWQADR